MSDTSTEFDLTTARLNAGHTRRSLAKELDLDHRIIARLETGMRVSPASAKVVADRFNVLVTDVMPAEPEPA